MTRLAEFCLESYRFHERLVVFLPDGMPLKVPVTHNTFHVVCQNILWNSHIAESVKHSNEQIAELQKIRKCVDIALKAEQPEQTQNRTKRQEQER